MLLFLFKLLNINILVGHQTNDLNINLEWTTISEIIFKIM